MTTIHSNSSTFGAKVRFLAVASTGLFLDGYLNIVIGLVVPIIGYIYFKDEKGSVPTIKGDEIKGSLSLGMIVGQLGFGLFGDALGRRRVYGKELIFTILGTLMVVLLPWKGLSQIGVVAWISIFRCLTGVGVGGDYPMSASLSAEKAPVVSRAVLVLTVFSGIGLGAFTSSIIYLILLSAFKSSIEKNINHLEWVWRLLLGFGIIPAALTLYARLTIRETEPYEKCKHVANDASRKQNAGFKDQFREFNLYFRNWQHAKVLFAVSASWFLYDIAYYGINLNQSVVLSKIGYGKGATPYETLHRTAVGNIIVQAAGYLPGFYVGIFLPDLMGRKRQQFWLSLAVAIIYAIWAGVSKHASTGGLMTLFALSQFALNAGPNCTTFLLPVELFPTRVRGTAHGIAAASGKAGAVLTAFAFGSIQNSIGIDGVLGLLAGVMALVALVTLMIPESKGRTLEDIEEDLLFKQGLINKDATNKLQSPQSPNGSTTEKGDDQEV